jgi:Txe/YoeB family toxin of toxin-antitoxin system
VTWALVFAKHAQKDAQKLAASGLKGKAQELLDIVRENPFQNPPPYEKLVGDLQGTYSRRINIQHRLVYQVLMDKEIKTVKVLRMWSHYE